MRQQGGKVFRRDAGFLRFSGNGDLNQNVLYDPECRSPPVDEAQQFRAVHRLDQRHPADDPVDLVSLKVTDEMLRAVFISALRVFFQKFLHFVLAAGIHAGLDGLADPRRIVHFRGRHEQNGAVVALQRRRDVFPYDSDVLCDRAHSMTCPS